MQTGAVKVPKTAQYVGTDADNNSYDWTNDETVGSDIVVLFDGDGKAKSDTWDGDKYYAKQGAAAAYMYIAPKRTCFGVRFYRLGASTLRKASSKMHL